MSSLSDAAPTWGGGSTQSATNTSTNSSGSVSGWGISASVAQLDVSLDNGEASGGWSKLKRLPSFGDAGPMVTINVGKGKAKKQYLIHKNFATHYSPVFDRAFNGKFVEAKTQTYNIEDFEFPDVFTFVVKWIYSEFIGLRWRANRKGDEPTIEDVCKLWVLGDRLLMPDLQNSASQELCYSSFKTDNAPSLLEQAAWIYAETAPESPLRRLFARKCAYDLEEEVAINSETGKLPIQLIVDIASVYKHDALAFNSGRSCRHDSDGWGSEFRGFDHAEYQV